MAGHIDVPFDDLLARARGHNLAGIPAVLYVACIAVGWYHSLDHSFAG
jgi:hypothetical protein